MTPVNQIVCAKDSSEELHTKTEKARAWYCLIGKEWLPLALVAFGCIALVDSWALHPEQAPCGDD